MVYNITITNYISSLFLMGMLGDIHISRILLKDKVIYKSNVLVCLLLLSSKCNCFHESIATTARERNCTHGSPAATARE